MKNYLDDLRKKLEDKKAEEEAISKQIEELADKIAVTEELKSKALVSGDNSEYLARYREIEQLKIEQGGLESLLKAKKDSLLTQEEVAKAWKKTLASFTSSREKRVDEYRKLKQKLAKIYIECLREENALDQERLSCGSLTKIQYMDGRFPDVPFVEANRRNANLYLKVEIEKLGINFTDLTNGKL